ncbi:uncharacterized protein LOC117641068 [Thrips palmi]|uniref:Uncharacterized protein LOC117641068 n=1 Tax=Thrips palmi TaxID=161013 RepID=A0A6P8Y3I0_THRPL|nr:uncharacterized protein LOC117641068 [Thrips palmi]
MEPALAMQSTLFAFSHLLAAQTQAPDSRLGSLVPRDSGSSAAGLGIEPAMQSTLYAFSHLLRNAASRESLASAPSSVSPPPGSPGLGAGGLGAGLGAGLLLPNFTLHLHHKPRASFSLSACRLTAPLQHWKPRSKSQANIACNVDTDSLVVPDNLFSTLRQSNKRRSKSHANIAKAVHKDTPEQEILAFQKQLQNLPDFDSPEHPTGGTASSDPVTAAAEFLANRPYLRPRSRSMPRVTYESSRYLTLPEEWMRESRVELERNAPLCREVRDFQAKVQACGPPYQQWCAELRAEFPALAKDPDHEDEEDKESTNRQYCHLVQLVVGGDLPCSKEDAAALAGIQLRLEESWGRTTTKDTGPMSPVEASALRTISEDKVRERRGSAAAEVKLGVRQTACT